jgi:hypothetical protein
MRCQTAAIVAVGSDMLLAMLRRALMAALSILLSCSTGSAAQEPPAGSQPQAEKPARKLPAPPLFPRHRRGIYRNAQGVDLIDATPQSPPLETDDPGVPDQGEYEINLTLRTDYAKPLVRFDLLLVDANYGMLPVIAGYRLPSQLKLEFPVSTAREAGQPYRVGLGGAKIGLKLNFYRDEQRGISVSLYPQVEFPTPGGRGVEKRLTENGQTLILPLLVSREFHEFTFVFNGGLEKPLHDPRRDTGAELGVAFGRAFTRKVAVMIELRTSSSVDFRRDRLVFVNAGLIHGVRNIIVYANLGHSLFSDDGFGHTYAGIGMKLLVDPKKKRD